MDFKHDMSRVECQLLQNTGLCQMFGHASDYSLLEIFKDSALGLQT